MMKLLLSPWPYEFNGDSLMQYSNTMNTQLQQAGMQNNKPLIIGISGKKQSGKDEVAKMLGTLVKKYNLNEYYTILSFAFELKKEVSNACKVGYQDIEKDKESFRAILQWWGTDFRRKNCPNYWVDKLADIIHHTSKHVFIISDVRFKNEAQFVKDNGGVLFRVKRSKIPSLLGNDTHPSETDLDDYKEWDAVIGNTGTLEDLQKVVEAQFVKLFVKPLEEAATTGKESGQNFLNGLMAERLRKIENKIAVIEKALYIN